MSQEDPLRYTSGTIIIADFNWCLGNEYTGTPATKQELIHISAYLI
jgi:hypothetical protein